MFGHQDSSSNDAVAPSAAPQDDSELEQSVTPQTIAPTADASASDDADAYNITVAGSSADSPSDDASDDTPAATPISDILPPAPEDSTVSITPETAPEPVVTTTDTSADDILPVTPTATTPPAATDNAGLYELKIAALHELTPLIDHLEQTAEEKFKTMMMMIQASDDQTLLAEAYQAAHSIEDKKARAQALLDVVNEINYFTQQQPGQAGAQQ